MYVFVNIVDAVQSNFDDEVAVCVANDLKTLKYISVFNSPLTDVGIRALLNGLPLLTKATVDNCLLSP